MRPQKLHLLLRFLISVGVVHSGGRRAKAPAHCAALPGRLNRYPCSASQPMSRSVAACSSGSVRGAARTLDSSPRK